MNLFSKEDFPFLTDTIANRCAETANKILKDRGEVFYGFGHDSDFWQREKDHRYLQYHTALVVCKTPIKED